MEDVVKNDWSSVVGVLMTLLNCTLRVDGRSLRYWLKKKKTVDQNLNFVLCKKCTGFNGWEIVSREWGYNVSSTFQIKTGECWIYALCFSVNFSVFVWSIQCYHHHMGVLERLIRPVWPVKALFSEANKFC